MHLLPIGGDPELSQAFFSPDGLKLLTAPVIPKDTTQKGRSQLWDTRDGRLITTYAEIQLCDAKTGKLLRTLSHAALVIDEIFSYDGSMILSASEDNTIKLWRTSTGELLKTFAPKSDYDVLFFHMAFSPDGKKIAAGGYRGKILVWDISDCISVNNMNYAFMAKIDELAELAFDDQCTGANPQISLISEIKELYIKADYGEV